MLYFVGPDRKDAGTNPLSLETVGQIRLILDTDSEQSSGNRSIALLHDDQKLAVRV